ncbi:putative ABC transporter C family member 15 isoform X2 [Tripterygium wilfordii]|uniref:putative ABC transporter C family member 15 isoform X2 n=1 Tax=Tripterygium wilfordii TaxID=458696 RepID=UPI0018F85758|nr:putative ABC transporter C family member 15 isoform X2 [Tripterygium wilfordii]
MDISNGVSIDIINLAFGFLFLAWVLIEVFRSRRDRGENQLNGTSREMSVFTKITPLSNLILSILYMGFGLYEYWDVRIISWKSLSLAITWILAAGVAFCSQRRSLREGRGWPVVIVLWWLFSFIFETLSVSFYIITYFRFTEWPNPLPKPSIPDFVSLLLLILLCFNAATTICCCIKLNDLEHPLLQKESGKYVEKGDSFTKAGLWSKLSFRWLNPLFDSGRTQKLELVNVPLVPQSEAAEHASLLLEESLRKRKIEASSLSKAIASAIWKSLAVNAIFAGPVLITKFVNFLSSEHEDSTNYYGLILAFVFLLSKTVESLTQRQWYFGAHRIGVRVRAALMVLVFKKSLSTKFASTSNGKITNLINVDVERIGDFFSYIHGVWLLPVQIFLALVILYWNLGLLPAVAALSSTILVMVSNTPLARMQEKFHLKIMEAKDSRVKATSETLKSMRVLKLHSWESTFSDKIFQLRGTESNWLKKYLYTCSAVAFLFWASPTLVSVITFGVCILLETPLSPSTVLSALATFRILQEPIYNLPELISMIAQTKVSIDRIEEFITEDDQKWLTPHQTSRASNIAIEIEKGEYAWDASDPALRKPTIKITGRMKILKGDKVAICGTVGSGKSSLLCSILGEIPCISGAGIKVHGKKAYVAQSPWIQTGTIRENILFGKHMKKAFYEDVVEGCALNQDIHLWADGDLSLVGERGMNLSGGQKQRVQLARAVYSDSDVYILDDPFSAVDAHTGTHLFKKCMMQLLSRKTVVYATHQLEFLDAADLVLVMKDGMIVQSGKYADLIADSKGELVRQMTAHRNSLKQVNQAHVVITSTSEPCQVNENEVMEENIGESVDNCNPCGISGRTQEEASETGRVKWSIYSTFVTSAYKGALVPVILICQVLFQGLQMGSNYWIAWATEEERMVSREKLIGVFILLSGGSSIFILGRAVFLATIAVETAQNMFRGMTESIFRAPISFFDATPTSRILNRSSADQSIVDTDIPYRLAGLVFALIQLFSVIILMSQIAWHVFLLFLAILGISAWYQAYYITTARELARMVGIRKAPILHHFSESIAGATTIRCFNQEDRFLVKIFSLIDDYSRVVFHNSGTMEWLCVRINFLFNLVVFIVLIILVSLPKSAIDPSLAGLAATYGLNLNVLQAWVIWNLCNVENKMISVERILQFTNIPSEAPLVIANCRPNPEWPMEGKIELRELHVQYSPTLPMVLRGISCIFPGKKKIGVVGRTGSGKSTLIQALFRVVEPSRGQIVIDGLDISKIGLQDLRSALGIIPQDPTLFQGTMRHNLDPLQQHSDQEIWEVLNKCRLAEIVRKDARLLDAPVEEDGENWSIGQRQLVCLARMLLKPRRILVLDEATASIDTATDNVIQQAIRKQTSRCTVITVAHRIPTVIDNDLVLVLDEGKVVEYNSPLQLLDDSSSSFSKLVAEFLRRSDNRDD